MARRPSMQALSGSLAAAAREIAQAVAGRGARAYLVGGAPRDLALGRAPLEIDMASTLRPEAIEALFESTVTVGRAFGTVIVRARGVDVQVTTFRSESGYSDARRPDAVAYGSTVEGDSSRRDFTCNALYLHPQDDEFLDPQGGIQDLEAGRLRCVGDPEERFREDGLRLLRLARFAAALDLVPDPRTLEAARRSGDSMRGVSRERVREELRAILEHPGSARAIALLSDLDLLVRSVPALEERCRRAGGERAWWDSRAPLFALLPDPPGLALGLAVLLDGADPQVLRPSRTLVREVESILDVADAAAAALAGSRSERLRWMRGDSFAAGFALARARAVVAGEPTSALDAARDERERLEEGGLRPPAHVGAEDLVALGLVPGPRFGEILREAETLQLDGVLPSREAALAWLARAAHESRQDGGKTPRRKKETG